MCMGNSRHDFLGSDAAVSSVISVVLMVAVTIIVASGVGIFAFDLGGGVTQPAPSAAFEYDYDSDTGELTVTYGNGDTLDAAHVRFAGAAYGSQTSFGQTNWAGEITGGDSATVRVNEGETLRVVWRAGSDSEQTDTLGEFEVPNQGPTVSGLLSNGAADAGADTFELDVGSDVALAQDGQATLAVDVGADGSVETTTTVSSSGTRTLSTSGIDYGETVRVTAYETTSQSNSIGVVEATDEASAAFESVVRTEGNDGVVEVTMSEIRTNDGEVFVVVDDAGAAEGGDASEVAKRISTTGSTETFDLDGGSITPDETITVTVYESDSRNENDEFPTADV